MFACPAQGVHPNEKSYDDCRRENTNLLCLQQLAVIRPKSARVRTLFISQTSQKYSMGEVVRIQKHTPVPFAAASAKAVVC